jgi:hypothetical protein
MPTRFSAITCTTLQAGGEEYATNVCFALLAAFLLAINFMLAEVSAGHGFILADAQIATMRLYSITNVRYWPKADMHCRTAHVCFRG